MRLKQNVVKLSALSLEADTTKGTYQVRSKSQKRLILASLHSSKLLSMSCIAPAGLLRYSPCSYRAAAAMNTVVPSKQQGYSLWQEVTATKSLWNSLARQLPMGNA